MMGHDIPAMPYLDEVNGDTLASEPSRPPNPMNIQLSIVGKVVVNNQ